MIRFILITLFVTIISTGCSETRRVLGYDKVSPDEFTVLVRAPLEQPPDYNLRPPMLGVKRPQEEAIRDKVKSVLFSERQDSIENELVPNDRSEGELDLLSIVAGGNQIDPNIRKKVDEETTSLIEADSSFSNKIMFWQTTPSPGEVLDSKLENERIQQNASIGNPISEGNSPQIIHRKKGWLER
jgi:hypothetical protein